MKTMLKKKTFFSYYIEELRIRLLYCFWSFLLTFLLCSLYTYESLYIFLLPYGRSFIFTDSGELFFQTFFFHLLLAFLWTMPYHITQCFSFLNPLFIKSQKTWTIFFVYIFFFFYILFIFIFLNLSFFLFHFFLARRIETFLLSIHGEIRMTSICWNIFQCFLVPIPWILFLFFFIRMEWKFSRWYGWIFLILGFAWLLPPDFLVQCIWSMVAIVCYEWFLWIRFFFQSIPSKE